MAGVRAILAVSQSLIGILETRYRPDLFDLALNFRTLSKTEFEQRGLNTGISVHLNQMTAYSTLPETASREGDTGKSKYTHLPLELHLVVTIWATDKAKRQKIARWVLAAFHKSPILPASMLNTIEDGAFRSDEAFELTPGDPFNKESGKMGITMGPRWLSIPYVARMVRVEAEEMRRSYA